MGTREGKDSVKRRMQERGTLLGSTTKEGTSKSTNKKKQSWSVNKAICRTGAVFD